MRHSDKSTVHGAEGRNEDAYLVLGWRIPDVREGSVQRFRSELILVGYRGCFLAVRCSSEQYLKRNIYSRREVMSAHPGLHESMRNGVEAEVRDEVTAELHVGVQGDAPIGSVDLMIGFD